MATLYEWSRHRNRDNDSISITTAEAPRHQTNGTRVAQEKTTKNDNTMMSLLVGRYLGMLDLKMKLQWHLPKWEWALFLGAFEIGKIEQTVLFDISRNIQTNELYIEYYNDWRQWRSSFFLDQNEEGKNNKQTNKRHKHNSLQLRIAFKFGPINCREEWKRLFFRGICNTSKLFQSFESSFRM